MNKLYSAQEEIKKDILVRMPNVTKFFDRKDKSISPIDYNENSIITLLKGPDAQYKKILMNENEQQSNVPIINDQCREKNSFLQIHVRPLNAKQQKRLLKKQYRQLSKRYYQSIEKKNKGLHFTFPFTYPCPKRYKRNQPSIISNSSIPSQLSSPLLNPSLQRKANSQFSNDSHQLKSAVSISFIDDKSTDMSISKIPKQNHSTSFLHVPSKKKTTHRNRSSNASIQKYSCQLCSSILSNGICSCIVQYLLRLNYEKENDFLVQLNDIFENLTSNNIIT